MLCDECCEFTDNYTILKGNIFCRNCLQNYLLVPCPGNLCNNIISLNGYDNADDTENYTCTECDSIFCEKCLVKGYNVLYCKDCFNS